MKTLIFSISLIVLGFDSGVSYADPYDQLAWGPVDPRFESSGEQHRSDLSVLSFRTYFRHKPPAHFRALLKECGIPDEEWDSNDQQQSNQTLPARMPEYPGGHLFRFNLADGAHVYIWTGEADAHVMRADYFSNSGRMQPLYLETL